MSNFFEQELRRLFGGGEIIQDPKFVGRTCLGDLGGGLWVRAEFVTAGVAGKYEALRLIVLKRTEGEVDRLILPFWDMFATQAPHTQLSGKPYIFTCHGVSKWYNSQPTADNYQALRQAAGDYLNVFRERGQERERPAPVRKSPGHSASNKGGTVMDQNDILQARLDQNYRDYVAQLQGKTADELIALAPEIVAAQQLRDELACACSEESLDFLLGFEDPLGFACGYWKEELMRDSHSDEIGHMLWEIERRGEIPLQPAKHTPHRPKRDQER